MGIIFSYLVICIYLILKDEWQKYFRRYQISKKTYTIINSIKEQQILLLRLYLDERRTAN